MEKVVVITGASSGLGLSHAVYLTSLGYTVFGTSRNASKIDLKKLGEIYRIDHTKWKFVDKEKIKVKAVKSLIPKKIEENLQENLAKITFFSMDVTSDNSVNKAIKEMEAAIEERNRRGIDVLINNAGIGFFGSIEELSMDDWKENFETNFFGVIRVIKAVLPGMKERGTGQIINTNSLGGLIAIPFQTHYSAAKSAMKVLTEGLRMELKQFNIKVSSILPSDINTNFNRHTLELMRRESSNLASTNIKGMIEALKLPRNSSYSESAKKVWKVIIRNLIVSPPPIVISKKLAKIIKAKKPRINYKAGMPTQILSLFLMRRLLPDKITAGMLASYYEL